jgi:hypothetical protein
MPPAYEVLLLNTAIPQIQAAQAGDTYVVPRNIAVNADLSVTGNTTLGDATTDTVQVNGYMGVGGAATVAAGVYVQNSALSGTTQSGIYNDLRGTSGATAQIKGFVSNIGTAAASFTVSSLIGFEARNAVKGAGSTITDQHGVYIVDQTQGTNNYGITSLVSSGTNKWNIYASGTAANYFAGNVGIGTSTPGAILDVSGSVFSRITNSTAPTLDNSTHAGESLFLRSGGTSGSSNVQAVLAFGKADGTSLRSGSAIASVQTTADTDQIGLGFYVSASTSSAQTLSQAMLITSAGNVSIGGNVDRATTVGTNALQIFNGTAPVGTLANGISLYSSSGEAYVMDAAGNATLFSPHDAETNEWIFKSKHTPSGKVLKIDVERLLRFVNDHFGLDAVQEFIES